MKALVTGAAGFIGSHLSEELLNQKFDVVGIDAFTDNYSARFKKDNLKKLLENKKFTFLKKDLLKFRLDDILKDTEYIFHLAALPGVRQSWGKYFNNYLENNVLLTNNLLDQVKNFKIKKFVFASSSSVYGDQDIFPIPENAPKNPLSPYGVTKLAAENICDAFFKAYSIPIIRLRYFTVYGPRQRPDMAFHLFMRKILDNKPIKVFGDGNQKRDFTYVKDIVDATIASAFYSGENECFNVGSHRTTSVNDVFAIMKKICNKDKIKIEYVDKQKGDVLHTYSDIDKAVKHINYSPSFSLEEGLEQQCNWMKSL